MSQETDIIKNPVKRDGISQKQRRLAALDPSFIKPDERTLEDFLVFTLELSKRICFYDLENKPDGTWEDFWWCDPTVVIAAIEKTNPLPDKRVFEEISEATPSVKGLRALVVQVLSVAGKIDYWYQNLLQGSGLQIEIKRYISANLKNLLILLATYEAGAKKEFPDYPEINITDYEGFSKEWDPIPEDPDNLKYEPLFRPEPLINEENPAKCFQKLTDLEKLTAAYAGLKKLFTNVYNVYFQIIRISPVYFEESLKRKDHTAHLALFITFLQLYTQVKDDLNQITKRHLDFYYNDVLQIKPKEAVPDNVHLFFELAKNRTEHELESGIRFKAGKDAKGNELFYALDKTAVLNIARVESLKTVFLSTKITGNNKKVTGIHAAPVANSADGLGAEITDEEKPSWATLGNETMPEPEIGFAIASNELLLAEGTRKVTLEIHTQNYISTEGLVFKLRLSGEKDWIDVDNVIPSCLSTGAGLKIEITLLPDKPAVVAFNSDTLKENLGTDLPVLKIMLQNSGQKGAYPYEQLRNTTIEKILLTVNVSGVQQVMAFNDEGAIDTKKPFLPFTANPKAGSSFYVGNAEAFQKYLNKVTLNLTWELVPENFAEYYAGYEDVSALNEDLFTVTISSLSSTGEKSDSKRKIFKPYVEGFQPGTDELRDIKSKVEVSEDKIPISCLLPLDITEKYGIDNKTGFLRLDLERDFEHDQFQQVLSRQLSTLARFPNRIIGAWYYDNKVLKKATSSDPSAIYSCEVVIPKMPYTPTLKTITLDYTSSASLSELDGNGTTYFLHLHPFTDTYQSFGKVMNIPLLPQFGGRVKQQLVLPKLVTRELLRKQNVEWFRTEKVLPVSNVLVVAAPPVGQITVLEEGALFIGLKNLKPRQSLSLLFQVAENTADAELPKSLVLWYYLASNEWIPFKEYEIVSDTTEGLLTSGIIEFTIPSGINKENSVMPSDLHWIKASVTENPGTISEAINIHAQAARITFQNNDNDLSRLSSPLPAGTISKLENSDAAIKSINQLYESFDGLPSEDDLSFYTRVSERLRHKGRAVTQYDYERLVLEAFPLIYKVKCINHTDENHNLCPGHVLISVVPDFTKLKTVDRRKPKVTSAQLEKIRVYLEERNCCFVNGNSLTLHVLNPVYEEIDFDFQVRFTPDVTAIDYYILKLKEAIARFLSPWAFEDAAEINFGGKVFKSTILEFVEKQSYVDYVTDFKMMHNGSTTDCAFIEAATPRSILVPVSEEEMNISHISADDYCNMENRILKEALGYQTLGESVIID